MLKKQLRCRKNCKYSIHLGRGGTFGFLRREQGHRWSASTAGGTQRVITGRIQWRYATQMNQSLEIGELGEREARSLQEHCHVSGWNAFGVTDAHEWGPALHGKACEQVCRFQRRSRLFYKSAWHHPLHTFYKRLHWLTSDDRFIEWYTPTCPSSHYQISALRRGTQIYLHLTPNCVE